MIIFCTGRGWIKLCLCAKDPLIWTYVVDVVAVMRLSQHHLTTVKILAGQADVSMCEESTCNHA